MNFEKSEINTAIAKAMGESCTPLADYLDSDDDGARFIQWGEARIITANQRETYDMLRVFCDKQIALASTLQIMNSTDDNSTQNTDAHSSEVDLDSVLREKFCDGKGVLCLNLSMPDDVLLSTIKYALSISDGKAFVVIPSLTTSLPSNFKDNT